MPDPVFIALAKPVAVDLLQIDPDDPVLPDLLSYGYYSGQLGDGRCVSLGQIPVSNSPGTPAQELQLKGCGRTPFSRFGDGYAVLRASVREFLASEFMAALGVPTTRALALVGGSRPVYREVGLEPAGCLTRVAPSWIRFGTFELCWYRAERMVLRKLADHVIQRFFPEVEASGGVVTVTNTGGERDGSSDVKPGWRGVVTSMGSTGESLTSTGNVSLISKLAVTTRPGLHITEEHDADGVVNAVVVEPYAPTVCVEIKPNRYARFFQEVIRRTAILVAHWQAVGFVHGVLNTDNMSILGVTLDYGPFMYMDIYDPWACSNETDELGRYRFENQPKMALWNLSKLGRTLVELVVLDEDTETPVQDAANGKLDGKDVIRQLLESFEPVFIDKYTELMRKKLGLQLAREGDLENLILPLLWLMADAAVDYTEFFRALSDFESTDTGFLYELGPLVDPPEGVELPEPYIKQERKASMSRSPSKVFSRRPSIARENASVASHPTSGCLDILLKSVGALRQDATIELEVFRASQPENELPNKAIRAAAA
ncbi:hypothetical protein HK405_005399, partial [Cladochytrium tenue]